MSTDAPVVESKPAAAAAAPKATPAAPAATPAAPKKGPRRPLPKEYEGLGLDEETLRALEAQEFSEDVVVTAAPLDLSRVAGSAVSVGEAELQQFDYSDVGRVLEKMPGVYLRGEDGYGLRPNIGLRGASSDRSSKVVLMEDGIPLAPAPYSAPAAYYFPMMDRVVGMEVYKGPAAIRFGPHTVGGAIDIRTREVPTGGNLGLIELAGGLEGYRRVHGAWGYGTDRLGVLVEGVHLQTTGFKRLDGGGDTGFDKNEVTLKARYATAPDLPVTHRLELRLGLANEDSDETYLGLADVDFQATPLRRYAASQRDNMRWLRSQARLTYTLGLGRPFELELSAYRNDFSRAWTKLNRFRSGAELSQVLAFPTAGQTAVRAAILRGEEDSSSPDEALMVGTNNRNFVSQGLQALATWRRDGEISHLVRAGARLHYDRIERRHTEGGFLMRSGVLVPESTAGETDVTTDNRGATLAFAAHVIDEILWNRLLVAPGIRTELIRTTFVDRATGNTGESFQPAFLPGVGALYHVTDDFSAIAGVHRGFSPVSPGLFTASPEYSVNYEAGGRFKRAQSEGELIGFFNDYSNLTRDCTFSSGCGEEVLNQQFDAGRVHVYGVEAMAAQELAGPWGTALNLRATYTLTLSRFLTSFQSENPQFGFVEAGDELPSVPSHQASGSVTARGERWTAALSATFVGEMRERAGQGGILEQDRVPARVVFDVAAGWKPTQSGEIVLAVENLFNARYLASRRPFGARPGRPFFMQVGYKHYF
ncbi:MAG TPA: TonB-dependent receptor [Longimicrobium sp.]|nr:TonB-dependent receptor [Longimicrobium sp.]